MMVAMNLLLFFPTPNSKGSLAPKLLVHFWKKTHLPFGTKKQRNVIFWSLRANRKITEKCILLQKIEFGSFFVNCKIENGILSEFSTIILCNIIILYATIVLPFTLLWKQTHHKFKHCKISSVIL